MQKIPKTYDLRASSRPYALIHCGRPSTVFLKCSRMVDWVPYGLVTSKSRPNGSWEEGLYVFLDLADPKPGEPFQRHFDLVSLLVPLLRIFKVTFAENAHNYWRSFGSICASFLFFIFSVRACERSEAERGRGVVEAAPQARPEDHFSRRD